MKDEIYFTQDACYSSKNVPPGWPLPPSYLDLHRPGTFGPGWGSRPTTRT